MPDDDPIMYWEYEERDEALTADSYDSDSAYEASGLGEMSTLASSIREYRYENGRRYHGYHEGQYVLPNDDQENERLNLQHHISSMMFGGKLHFAPIIVANGDPAPILDVGSGTGIWVVDVAEMYPTSQVIGMDLSRTVPAWAPPNCKFEVDDCEHDWTFDKDYFEFVHIRYLNGSIKDWNHLFQQAYQHTRPGGWVELQECSVDIHCDDNTLPPTNPLIEWFSLMNQAALNSGRPFEDCKNYKDRIARAGYENISERVFKLPFNGWPKDKKIKEIGRYQCLNMESGLEGWSIALFTRFLEWEKEQLLDYLPKVKKEFMNRNIHGYWKVRVTWGQKPTVVNRLVPGAR